MDRVLYRMSYLKVGAFILRFNQLRDTCCEFMRSGREILSAWLSDTAETWGEKKEAVFTSFVFSHTQLSAVFGTKSAEMPLPLYTIIKYPSGLF